MKIIECLEARLKKEFPRISNGDIKFLKEYMGELNKVYIFQIKEKKVAVKKLEVKGYWNNLEREYHVLNGLEKCKVDCPKAHFFDCSFPFGAILGLEYIDGNILSNETCRPYLERIADMTKRIHKTSINFSLFRQEDLKRYSCHFEVVEELKNYISMRLKKLRTVNIPSKTMRSVEKIVNSTNLQMLDKRKIFLGNNFSFCHKDLKVHNIVLQKNGFVKLIDWEHANISDPAFEIAIFFKNSRLNEFEINSFISTYGSPDKNFLDRINAYMHLFVAPSLIWHVDRIHDPQQNFPEERLRHYKEEMTRLIEEYNK